MQLSSCLVCAPDPPDLFWIVDDSCLLLKSPSRASVLHMNPICTQKMILTVARFPYCCFMLSFLSSCCLLISVLQGSICLVGLPSFVPLCPSLSIWHIPMGLFGAQVQVLAGMAIPLLLMLPFKRSRERQCWINTESLSVGLYLNLSLISVNS